MSSSMALQLRPKCRPISSTQPFVHFFSSSSSSSPPDPNFPNPNDNNTPTPEQPPPPPPPSSFSSYFSDVKSSLKQQQQHHQQRPTSQSPRRPPFSLSTPEKPPTKAVSFEEIRNNLVEFRRRSSPPSSTDINFAPSSSSQPISFQELYKRNVIGKPEDSPAESAAGPGRGGFGGDGGGKFSFQALRESLKHFKPSTSNVDRRSSDSMSLSAFKDNLKLRQDELKTGSWPTRVIGGSDVLPAIFDREIKEKKDGESSIPAGMKTEFVKMYSYGELGDKLRLLRPERKAEGENWFSLAELNERLVKLREIEEKETASKKIGGVAYKDLRDSLAKMKMLTEEKTKRSTIQRLDVLTHLGKTPNFMLSPPKEQLVEKFFHPDNMSSAEKLKIVLHKVRDEFKMSESDCGSARVQVAQLTTKIKHLDTALHKKDKHSRKGLVDMVEKRRKLLKYLRRTDWDSYCFVVSKLGLRDNLGYKMTLEVTKTTKSHAKKKKSLKKKER